LSGGLEGVVVADTVLSLVDPPNGRLWVRGVALPELVARHGYEGTVALLWEGFAGEGLTRAGMEATLGLARQAAFARLESWLPVAAARPLEAGVRLSLAMLPDDSTAADIAATLAVGVPALLRYAAGQSPLAPDASLPVAADLLRMLHGVAPDPTSARALDTYFTVMADSGMSASSFAARVVASTRASLACAVLGAWCAFTGPIHGGAPGPTLDLLDALAATDNVDAWIEGKLRAGDRLMGFGHRVYRGNDPRAAAMRVAMQAMGPVVGRLAFAATVEARVAAVVERVKPGRKLPANVEIMAAMLLDAVGIPRAAFTAVFAVGRCASWIAHALEQQKTGRMFRPESRYVGPVVG
jgi:citrate synthase